MNLHAIVRAAITTVHNDETCQLYQSTGQTNDRGVVKASYADPVTIAANIQPLSTEALARIDAMNVTGITACAFLYSEEARPVAGVRRIPSLRTGDYIQRADGTWWLVIAVEEDWSDEGWACVDLAQQLKGVE